MAVKSKGEFYDELEAMTPEERQSFQNRKLRQVVARAYKTAPLAKESFDKAEIRPADIRTVKDMEKVPVIRKADLIDRQRKSPPFGGLLAVPQEDIERVFISPGPIYEYQPSKIEWFARSFWAAGFRRGDIVVNTFTYHMSPAGILFHEALRDCGATVVVMGTGNTDILIQTMRDLKVTGFVGTPTFLMTVIKRAEELGRDFKTDFSVKRAWFTGEMLPPSIRKILEGTYGIDTYQAYAVTEPGGAIAYECKQKSGLHFMDDYILEIVDPQTGKQLNAGEIGEILVTPIHNKSWGLIRFGTGDMSSYTAEPCACGRTAYRLTSIVGRTGDAVKVRGMFVVAKQAEQVVMSFEPVSRFQIVVGREGQRDTMTLKLELKDESADRQKLSADLNEKFQNTCRVKLDKIEFVSKGTIPESAQKLVDERKWE